MGKKPVLIRGSPAAAGELAEVPVRVGVGLRDPVTAKSSQGNIHCLLDVEGEEFPSEKAPGDMGPIKECFVNPASLDCPSVEQTLP